MNREMIRIANFLATAGRVARQRLSVIAFLATALTGCAQGADSELRSADEQLESAVSACGGTELAPTSSYSYAGEISGDAAYETSCVAKEAQGSVLHWTVPVTGIYQLSVDDAEFMPALAIFNGECTDAELRCDQGSKAKSGEPRGRIELFAGKDVTIVVQSEDATQAGSFVLNVEYLGPAWE